MCDIYEKTCSSYSQRLSFSLKNNVSNMHFLPSGNMQQITDMIQDNICILQYIYTFCDFMTFSNKLSAEYILSTSQTHLVPFFLASFTDLYVPFADLVMQVSNNIKCAQ